MADPLPDHLSSSAAANTAVKIVCSSGAELGCLGIGTQDLTVMDRSCQDAMR